MAREIQTRWKVTGILTAETPIHIGGIGGDADTDLALAVNGCGNYYIPGTSLAGALRDWMKRSYDETTINNIWGFQKQDNGHASFIIVDDAEIILNNMTLEIREGVGINRRTGAAADEAKYSRAILPKGVKFPLSITLDIGKKENQNLDAFWHLIQALEQGDIRIGAAKTRGLGKVKLQHIKIQKHDWSTPKTLFDSLLKQNLKRKWAEIKQGLEDYNPQRLSLEITWNPQDSVMVKAEGDGIAVDILPLVSQVTGNVHFVIPGSSIKGVLRSHAERIVRTVCNLSTRERFLKQVQLNLVDEVFGAAENSNGSQHQGKMGALSVDDCYAKISMTAKNWSAVENAAKSDKDEFSSFKKVLKTAILSPNSTENPFQTLQPAMHVAVDRWTGGAADGMLYSVLEPIAVDWGQIGINLDLARLQTYENCKNQNKKEGEDREMCVQPAIALLLLVLRDFANRKLPIGYGTNRGMGTVEVTEMSFNCSPIEGLAGIDQVRAIAPDLPNLGLSHDLLNLLNSAWKKWIEQHNKKGL
ncbi:RAMP superfamily CRISPR-associated protein [Spirulina subsalsa]|uniref:RAMP superfamily CRISPR-associated protein n=1 Tax=Spirulina subsalsa TaxID=54311 RepID=UPI000310745E|nr:RAMP superfamily CRISPR-associated protein [Spirulina subsalsa]